LAAEIISGVKVVGAAVLGATKAALVGPDDPAADAGAEPDAIALVMAAEAGAEAAAEEDAELAGVLLELDPQALTTSALAATTANSIARVVRV
jgi:hypothetical protein